MDYIQYDPEQILNGFTEDVLKELAKKLKRRMRVTKSEIIQEILSPPKGKPEERVKIWQEINRYLRKELETFTQGECLIVSPGDAPLEEQFKLGYMFTLSTNPEFREMGEKLYCQADKNLLEKEVEKESAVTVFAGITAQTAVGETVEMIEDRVDEEETIESGKIIEMIKVRDVLEMQETGEVNETIETRAVLEMIETRDVEEMIQVRETNIMTDAKDEETLETGEIIGTTEAVRKIKEGIEESEELQKKIRILENKLRKANSEVLRTKGQLEKLKIDMVALRTQWIREKDETGKYRNRVKDLEEERAEKEKEIETMKQKLELRKVTAPQKIKEQLQVQRRDPLQVKDESLRKIDLASYQGRKALIFAERDNEIDLKLNSLGIIPIWAMEIDWNRPRRRMSTCEVVLYKMNDKRLKKLDEIRDIARYWNIPCNELLNI